AALLLTAAVVGAFLLPEDAVPFLHRSTAAKDIGVPVGVSDRAAGINPAGAPAPKATGAAASSPAQSQGSLAAFAANQNRTNTPASTPPPAAAAPASTP